VLLRESLSGNRVLPSASILKRLEQVLDDLAGLVGGEGGVHRFVSRLALRQVSIA
jgi:hypothetical protein